MRYSNSSIQTFKTCPTKYFFKYPCRLRKIEDEASEHHLVFGRAGHEALRLIYLGTSLEEAKKKFVEIYPRQLDENDKAKTQANGLIMLENYVKRWSEEDKKWRVVSVEDKDSFGYGNEDSFVVVLDLVLENKEFGGIYGMDHKIVGGQKAYINEAFWYQFEPNSQVTKYYSYIKKKYGDCSGFYINAIGMGHRERAYKGEPAGAWQRFSRMMFNRNEANLSIEERDTEVWIKRIEMAAKDGYGMNTESCRFCEFRDVCKAGWTWDNDRELILINYKQSPIETEKEVVHGNSD